MNKRYWERRLDRVSTGIDALKEKASKEHLGGQDSANLKKLMSDKKKFAKRLKREKHNGKTKTQ